MLVSCSLPTQESDRERLYGTHWSYDPGAEPFTRELSESVASVGILSRFSRLLCDPNRPLGSETMFRSMAEGAPVELNAGRLSEEEVAKRVERLYRPYHAALKRVHEAIRPTLILAPHRYATSGRKDGSALRIDCACVLTHSCLFCFSLQLHSGV